MGADSDVTPDWLLPPDWFFCPHPVSAIADTASTTTEVTIALCKLSSSEVDGRTLLSSSGLCAANRTSHVTKPLCRSSNHPSRTIRPKLIEEQRQFPVRAVCVIVHTPPVRH